MNLIVDTNIFLATALEETEKPKIIPNSAFDVAGIKTQATKKDILAAISKSRKQGF
ncbi:hypothetical protein SPONL_972 [uncultured Candidatus Thioglobus sp.]|nr:hypothetical protein SPONL_972 [uncultured Candidatus Thioglobus sp.]